MYAPKFKSWVSDEERFNSALDYKINSMVAEAKAEIRRMYDEALVALIPGVPVEVLRLGPTATDLRKTLYRELFAQRDQFGVGIAARQQLNQEQLNYQAMMMLNAYRPGQVVPMEEYRQATSSNPYLGGLSGFRF